MALYDVVERECLIVKMIECFFVLTTKKFRSKLQGNAADDTKKLG